MSDPGALKKGALTSATYDTVLQIGLRIMSFVLNAFIVRQVSRESFAVMSVRLHLLYSTGLLLSREAFRRAALSSKGNKEIYKVINLLWTGTLVSLPVGLLGWYIWMYVMEQPPESVTRHYSYGVLLILTSVVTEVIAEVPFVLAELQLWSKTKVVIEGVMQLLRSLLLALFVFLWPMHSVLVFGISQMLGSIVYSASYYIVFMRALRRKEDSSLPIHEFNQLLPKWSNGKMLPEVDHELGLLSWSFFKQGWLKEALTEGEHYIMNFFPLISLNQQGVYQVVNNLGSLAARLVFRSIEAAAYKYFAQMLYRGKSIKDQDQSRVAEVSRFFLSLFSNLILVSLLIITFGWSYSRTLLQIYGGSQLSDDDGTLLMRAQCFYVVFLAVNGITEAYTFAVMDDAELSSLRFISDQYKDSEYQPLQIDWVSGRPFFVFASCLALTTVSEAVVYPRSIILHIIFGFLCLILVAYLLRMEFKPVFEKLFDILDSCTRKLIGEGSPGNMLNPLVITKYLRRFLYGSTKK
ncbi:man(5)GlcNAc(2)-PP-dolichol translocation protein RFT1 isoform X2 [Macrobrachium rosenbergii]|uniref:man(5)GlcNAc(2)-PP-dolichol translocation protein RFT1 isoform X2 n=1 Tax=Macrobrachium rosenbergii TaxID=79674 RepID=UPI0034D6DD61